MGVLVRVAGKVTLRSFTACTYMHHTDTRGTVSVEFDEFSVEDNCAVALENVTGLGGSARVRFIEIGFANFCWPWAQLAK